MESSGLKRHDPLYLKYRPQSLADLVGQSAAARALANGIASGRISHAYLFTGPRGTGKTSSARILAKSVNCQIGPTAQPCQECTSCIEIKNGISPAVFEIDAASNNSVDDARALIERAPLVAVGGRYKLYIIDECHMLTKEAFNALLKTIEEPPPNVIFVLATTEEHKVPPTIVSRCQRLMFRLVNQNDLVGHLRSIAEKEQIAIEDQALDLIARRSGGGLRDAIGLLDQASLLSVEGKPVNITDLLGLLGALNEEVLLKISAEILHRQGHNVLELVNQLIMEGREPSVIAIELTRHFLSMTKASYLVTAGNPIDPAKAAAIIIGSSSYISGLLEQATHFERAELSQIVEQLGKLEQTIRRTSQPVVNLEIGLLSICHRHDVLIVRDLEERIRHLEAELLGGGHPGPAKTKAPVVVSRPIVESKGNVAAPNNNTSVQSADAAPQSNSSELQDSNRTPQTSSSGLQDSNRTPQLNSSGLQDSNRTPQLNSSGLQDSNRTPQSNSSELQDSNHAPQSNSSGLQDSNRTPQLNSSELHDTDRTPQTSSSGSQDSNRTPQLNSSGLQDSNRTPQSSSSGLHDSNRTPQSNSSGLQDSDRTPQSNSSELHDTDRTPQTSNSEASNSQSISQPAANHAIQSSVPEPAESVDQIKIASEEEQDMDLDLFWSQLLDQLQKVNIPAFSVLSEHAFPLAVNQKECVVGVLSEHFKTTVEKRVEKIKVACDAVLARSITIKVKIASDPSTKAYRSQSNSADDSQEALAGNLAQQKETMQTRSNSPESTNPRQTTSSNNASPLQSAGFEAMANKSNNTNKAKQPVPDEAASESGPRVVSGKAVSSHLNDRDLSLDAHTVRDAYKIFEGPGSRLIV